MLSGYSDAYKMRSTMPESLGDSIHTSLENSCNNWVLQVDEGVLLNNFKNRPGVQPWVGEHVGKWLLGAIEMHRLLNHNRLGEKIIRVAEALLDMQEQNGYWGTYLPRDRWKHFDGYKKGGLGWDVWVHKYCILSLLSYAQWRGESRAIEACMKAADNLIAQFQPPRTNDFNKTDVHAGLASGSFLEPLMFLYRKTGEDRYLDFGRYLVENCWQKPDGPRIIPILQERADIGQIGMGKAYEMMSCFVGLLEFGRAAKQPEYIDMVIGARDRIAENKKYPSGGMSSSEWFLPDGQLPEHARIETCVAFTWMQLNSRIHSITGDERSINLIEQVFWNQLLPALSPDGSSWSYFLPITGPKVFSNNWLQGTDRRVQGASISCCHTNGQRGLCLFPQFIYTCTEHDVFVNFFLDSEVEIEMPQNRRVRIIQKVNSRTPREIELEVVPIGTKNVNIQLRMPPWAESMAVDKRTVPKQEGCRVRLAPRGRKCYNISVELQPQVTQLSGELRGKYSISFGPYLYAVDTPPEGSALDEIALNVDSKDPSSTIAAVPHNDWIYLRVPAKKISDIPVVMPSEQNTSEMIQMKPIQLAGLDALRSVDGHELKTNIDKEGRSRQLRSPEYRAILPWTV